MAQEVKQVVQYSIGRWFESTERQRDIDRGREREKGADCGMGGIGNRGEWAE